MIKNIVFDFGGVLVEYSFERLVRPYFDSEEGLQYFMHHCYNPCNEELDRGVKAPEELFADLQRQWPQYQQPIQAIYDRYEDIFIQEPDGMRQLMTELKAQGYPLLGLSNWSSLVARVMRKFPDIFALLDGMLISKDVHLLKPDRAIYDAFLTKFGVQAAECVFIDDKAENIVGCQQAGMHGIQFHSVPQLRRELGQLISL